MLAGLSLAVSEGFGVCSGERCRSPLGRTKVNRQPAFLRQKGVRGHLLPRSRVRARRKSAGSVSKVLARASFILISPYPGNTPILRRPAQPPPVCRGRWTTIANRVVRSIRVAIADRLALGAGATHWLKEAAAGGTGKIRHKWNAPSPSPRSRAPNEVDKGLGAATAHQRFTQEDPLSIVNPPAGRPGRSVPR